jgi:hypothetical protein
MKRSFDRKFTLKAGVLFGALGIAPVAQAQFEPWVAGRPGEQHIHSRFGTSIQGGGGVIGFTGSSENNVSNIGGSWDVRAVFGTRTIAALEAAYVGTTRELTAGPGAGAGLMSNGAEGVFRLNAPFLTRETLIEPFAFAGLGWAHYRLNDTSRLQNVFVGRTSDDIATIPIGGGLALGYHGFIFEARFTYRPTFDNDLALTANGSRTELDTWNAGAMIGFEF